MLATLGVKGKIDLCNFHCNLFRFRQRSDRPAFEQFRSNHFCIQLTESDRLVHVLLPPKLMAQKLIMALIASGL